MSESLKSVFLHISQSLVPWGHCWKGDKEAGKQFAQHHVGGLARSVLCTIKIFALSLLEPSKEEFQLKYHEAIVQLQVLFSSIFFTPII